MSKQVSKIRMSGTPERPRLRASVSNRHVTAQVIDDTKGVTIAYSTSVNGDVKGSLSDKAAWVGSDIAKKAKQAKIKQVLFDRGVRRYHGRIKVLAEAARKEGLEF